MSRDASPPLSGLPFHALAERLNGRVLRPGDASYEDARALWNGMIDTRPAAIARCVGDQDVRHAVTFAAEHGVPLAIRGGGHNVAGYASVPDGLVIDLSEMRRVEVDAERRVAHAEGGATWADLDRATQAFGLATPGGVVSKTGVAGLTLSGGIGWLRNKHGLSCDNLIGAEVVTADGELVRAREDDHDELLWGVRGGGGNFGVVTRLTYRLHPIGPEVMFAFVLYPAARAKELLRAYRSYCASAPDEVTSFAILGVVPDEPSFPEAIHGEPYLLFAAMYAGDPDSGREALRPLRDQGEPLLDLSDVMPYVEAQQVLDEDYPDGMRYYWKATYLADLEDAAIDRLIEHAYTAPSPASTVDVWHLGGALRRVPAGATAFGDRSAPFLLGVEANWEDPATDEANVAWTRACVDDLRRFGGGMYLNFPGFPEEENVPMRDAYGATYARLASLKARYDPNNVFRRNANVEPAPAS